jgi:hypothetical protein
MCLSNGSFAKPSQGDDETLDLVQYDSSALQRKLVSFAAATALTFGAGSTASSKQARHELPKASHRRSSRHHHTRGGHAA